jgi:hypothetical protein
VGRARIRRAGEPHLPADQIIANAAPTNIDEDALAPVRPKLLGQFDDERRNPCVLPFERLVRLIDSGVAQPLPSDRDRQMPMPAAGARALAPAIAMFAAEDGADGREVVGDKNNPASVSGFKGSSGSSKRWEEPPKPEHAKDT